MTKLQVGLTRVEDRLGGPARARAIGLLAATLGLDAADKGAVGAVAFDLERSLHIGNADIGLLVAVSSLVGALATVPVGALSDRFRRVPLLWMSVAVWAIAQLASGLAGSFPALIASRVALGAVTATAGPTVASLTGDLFPARDRGRIYGFILTGEFIGAGIGVLVAGLASALFNWRAAFLVLVLPSAVLAWTLRRFLPEPARAGQSRIEEGALVIASVEEVEAHPEDFEPEAFEVERDDDLVLRQAEDLGIAPAEAIVVTEDPADMGIWHAVRYVLSVRTNVILIAASSLGYFFFAGLRTFAIVFLRGGYGLGQAMATVALVVVGLGAVGGLIVAGNAGDGLIRQGRIDGRLLVGVAGYTTAAILLAPAIASPWLALSLPLFVVAGAAVSAPNPALDAARLDVVPARLWGRAEGVRTMARQILEAFAPLLFGYVSQVLGGDRAGLGAGVDLRHAHVSAAQTTGLRYTILIMVVPLLAGGLVLLAARRSYPIDVASAGESDRRIHEAVSG